MQTVPGRSQGASRRQPMSRAAILDRLNAHDPCGAVAMLDKALCHAPRDPDLLGLKGIALADAGDPNGAETALRLALAEPATTAIRLRNGANLASILFEAGRRNHAAVILESGWRWDEDRPPEEKEQRCMATLAELMQHLALHEQIITLLSPVPRLMDPGWPILQPLARAMARIGDQQAAIDLLEGITPADAVEHERQSLLAYLLHATGRRAEAAEAYGSYLNAAPPVILAQRPSHKLTVGLVDIPPSFANLLRPWPRAYFAINYPAQLAQLMSDRYRIAGIFLGAGEAAVRDFNACNPDVVINNVTNAEYLLTGDALRRARSFVAGFSQQVINPPDAAIHCTRQKNPINLAGIEGLIVPNVRRLKRDMSRIGELMTAIESGTTYPLILRTVYEQEARKMILVQDREELEAAIRALEGAELYVIEYVGQPREHGCFRRMRAFYAGGKPTIVWVDYARSWIVQTRLKIDLQLYRDRPDLLQRANAIISNPHNELGDKAMAAIEAVGRTIPMDIFGMDFDVDDDGNVVFFEANATMRMQVPVPEEYAYPPEATQRLFDTLDQLFHQLAARRA